MALFLKILFTEFIAEMGDKTQLMLVAMTSKFKVKDIVLGTAVAVLVLNGLAVLLGGLVGTLIPAWIIKLIAAAAFLCFAITSLSSDDDEEQEKCNNIKVAPVAVFCTFFVAELGDKTQLTAITFGANEGIKAALVVWLACSIGLFAADIIGMLVGLLLKSKMPERFLGILAYLIFAVFGVVTLRTGLVLLFGEGARLINSLVIGVAAIFVVLSVLIVLRDRRKQSNK